MLAWTSCKNTRTLAHRWTWCDNSTCCWPTNGWVLLYVPCQMCMGLSCVLFVCTGVQVDGFPTAHALASAVEQLPLVIADFAAKRSAPTNDDGTFNVIKELAVTLAKKQGRSGSTVTSDSARAQVSNYMRVRCGPRVCVSAETVWARSQLTTAASSAARNMKRLRSTRPCSPRTKSRGTEQRRNDASASCCNGATRMK